MRKIYINPEIQVENVTMSAHLLDNSSAVVNMGMNDIEGSDQW